MMFVWLLKCHLIFCFPIFLPWIISGTFRFIYYFYQLKGRLNCVKVRIKQVLNTLASDHQGSNVLYKVSSTSHHLHLIFICVCVCFKEPNLLPLFLQHFSCCYVLYTHFIVLHNPPADRSPSFSLYFCYLILSHLPLPQWCSWVCSNILPADAWDVAMKK